MKNFLATLKLGFLMTALAIVGVAAFSDAAQASEVVCENLGHSCHVIIGDQTYHMQLVQ